MLPAYVKAYLDFIGAHSTSEIIAVESSDDSGLMVFNRFDHETQVLDGVVADLSAHPVVSDV